MVIQKGLLYSQGMLKNITQLSESDMITSSKHLCIKLGDINIYQY